MTQPIAVDKIQPNPWQTRLSDDPEHIQRLADDIKANGLLQTPLARAVNGHYELAFGHSRFAAWKLARPQEPFPLDVKELTDRQLSDFAASENAQRRNLSAIETATAIQRRMKDFSLSQLDAGKPFGYASQGSISNLLRLLKLPEHTRELVHSGAIPERIARMLIPVARMSQADADRIADTVVTAAPESRDREAEIGARRFFVKTGRLLNWQTPWKLDWPHKPIAVPPELALGVGGSPAEIPACKGCEFNADAGGESFCTRPPCYDVKWKLALQADLKKASTKLGIAIASADEKLSVVYDGNGYDQAALKRAGRIVLTKSPILRLALYEDMEGQNSGTYREEVFGSKHIMLMATDKAEANRLMASVSGAQEARRLAQADESEAQKACRVAMEEKSREAGRQERSKQYHARADINWLIRTAAGWLGKQIDARGGALEFLAAEVERQYWKRGNTSLFDAHTIAHRTELFTDASAAQGKAREELLRRRIVVDVLAHKIADSYQDPWYGWLRAKEVVAKVAEDEFRAKLPANWNQPPIHRGWTNCWQCGRFGSNVERITKGEEAQGWIVAGDGVACPECEAKRGAGALKQAGIKPVAKKSKSK